MRNNINSQKTTTELKSLFNSFDSYRQQWEEEAIESYKLYYGYKEETDDNRANIHIPRTYEIVDTLRSRIVNAFFQKKPYIEFVPLPDKQSRDSLEKAEVKSNIASGLVEEQLEKNDIASKYYDYITSLLIFPAAIMGVGWRYEEKLINKKVPVPEWANPDYGRPYKTGNFIYERRKSEEVIWDDNELTNVDFFDFWPDPKASDLEDCRGVFHREIITFKDLKNKLEYLDQLNEGVIYPVDFQEILEESPLDRTEGREKRMSEVGRSVDMGLKYYNSEDPELKENTKFEILHYWEDDRHAMLLNREEALYDGPSPYWRHHKIPFVVESYERLPNEFYGLSAVDIISDLQHEENAIHNQRSDNVNMILNKMWKVRRGTNIDESELISKPHNIIHVDNMEDVMPFEMEDVAASSFEQQNIVGSSAENALAATPIVRGAEGRRSKTATEAAQQSSNAGMRFQVKINLFNELGITRMVELMDLNNQQFIDTERIVKMGEEESIEWKTVKPGEIIGNFDYRPAGPNVDPAANKEIRREQLSQMMSFLMEAGIPFVDYHKLVKEWLESFDITNSQKFIMPEEQWQQQQQMQAQQNQQQQQNGNQGMQRHQNDRANQTDQQRAAQAGAREGRNVRQPGPTQQRAGGHIR